MKKLLSTTQTPFFGDLSILSLRLYAGLAMAFGHGIHKMPPSDQFLGGVESLGFPMPVVFAWAAALSEFIGGLLIAVGLFTRPAALGLAITMAVAGFLVHAQDPFMKKEMAFLYLVISLYFLFNGAGKLSIDSKLSK